MTSIEVFENSDGEVYTFTLKQKPPIKTIVDLTNYTAATMDLISQDLKTNYGTITLGFGTKASGEITYTTDTIQHSAYPDVPATKKFVDLLAQIKVTGTNLVTLTEEIEIRYFKDYSTIT